jgi:hypothetical protein
MFLLPEEEDVDRNWALILFMHIVNTTGTAADPDKRRVPKRYHGQD